MLKNLIFDFGGVLLNLNVQATKDAFIQLFQEDYSDKIEKDLEHVYHDFERGKISNKSFVATHVQLAKNEIINDTDVIRAWNSMLLDFPKDRLNMLLALRKKYRVFLLSNTNAIHIAHVMHKLEEVYGITDFNEKYFDKVWYSHEVGHRKPDASIYQFVLQDAGLKANESLFIDDNTANILAAREAGLHGQIHDPTQEITEMIHSYCSSVQ